MIKSFVLRLFLLSLLIMKRYKNIYKALTCVKFLSSAPLRSKRLFLFRLCAHAEHISLYNRMLILEALLVTPAARVTLWENL